MCVYCVCVHVHVHVHAYIAGFLSGFFFSQGGGGGGGTKGLFEFFLGVQDSNILFFKGGGGGKTISRGENAPPHPLLKETLHCNDNSA